MATARDRVSGKGEG